MDNTRDYARVSHSRQWSNYNFSICQRTLSLKINFEFVHHWPDTVESTALTNHLTCQFPSAQKSVRRPDGLKAALHYYKSHGGILKTLSHVKPVQLMPAVHVYFRLPVCDSDHMRRQEFFLEGSYGRTEMPR